MTKDKVNMQESLAALDRAKRMLAEAEASGRRDVADLRKIVEIKQRRVDEGGTVAAVLPASKLPLGENPYDTEFRSHMG